MNPRGSLKRTGQDAYHEQSLCFKLTDMCWHRWQWPQRLRHAAAYESQLITLKASSLKLPFRPVAHDARIMPHSAVIMPQIPPTSCSHHMLAPCHIMRTSRHSHHMLVSHARTVPRHAHVPALASHAHTACSHVRASHLVPPHVRRYRRTAVWRGRSPCRLAVSEAAGVASRASYRLPVPPPDSNGAVVALHAPKRALPVAVGTLPRRARNMKSGRRCQQRAWGGCFRLPRPVTPLP